MEEHQETKEQELKQTIQQEVKNQLASNLFSARKLTDMPTDDLMVVPRKYVNLNGTTANRPTSSITGQFYFDTTIGRPVYWTGSKFVDGAGSVS